MKINLPKILYSISFVLFVTVFYSCSQPSDNEVKTMVETKLMSMQKQRMLGDINSVLNLRGMIPDDNSDEQYDKNPLKIKSIEILKKGEKGESKIIQLKIKGSVHTYDTGKKYTDIIDNGWKEFESLVLADFSKNAFGEWRCGLYRYF